MSFNTFGFSTPRVLAVATVFAAATLGVFSGVFGTFSTTILSGNTCSSGYGYTSGYGYGYGYECTPTPIVTSGGGGGGGGGNTGGIPIVPGTTTPTPTVGNPSGTGAVTPIIVPKAKDIAESPFKSSIETLIEKGIVRNTTKFNPERSITRAEFIKMLVNSYGYEKKVSKKKFKDVDYTSDLALYISFGVEMGWINVRNIEFRPNDTITRGEAQKLINVINGKAIADTVAEVTTTITRAEAADMIVKGLGL